MANADSIAAIATPQGRGGIGIVRVSGPNLENLLVDVVGGAITPRRATLRQFVDRSGRPLDQGIALYYRRPHSYTGEDVVELHGHGGPAVLRLVLQSCLDWGARLAEPGEFTQRAFLNGKLDLAQAEAVADLIDTASLSAARNALRSLQGEFSNAINSLRDRLVALRTFIEATLDFPEEGIDKPGDVAVRLHEIDIRLREVLKAARHGQFMREGIRIALIGPPNVGKSSLLNRLAGEEIAIVTDIPGTTRDILQQSIQIKGVPIHLVDTAGLRESDEPVEKIGVARAWAAAKSADVVVLMGESGGDPGTLAELAAKLPSRQTRLFVLNKIDLSSMPPSLIEDTDKIEVRISARTGAGLDLLQTAMLKAIEWSPGEEGVYIARERHLRALADARRHVGDALSISGSAELVAEELRLAQGALAAITGEFAADDLLGEIFSKFCIGK